MSERVIILGPVPDDAERRIEEVLFRRLGISRVMAVELAAEIMHKVFEELER